MDVIEVCQRLERAGLIAGAAGNVSVRLSDQRVRATPSGRIKSSLVPEELVELGLDGRPLGGGRPSSEIAVHLAIYEAAEWARAVVHAHPPVATALASTHSSSQPLSFCVTAEGAASIGPVALTPYLRPGGQAIARVCAEGVVAGARVVLMRQHGAVSVGADLEEALARMASLEHVARIVAQARGLGRVELLPDEEVAALRRGAGLEARAPAGVFEVGAGSESSCSGVGGRGAWGVGGDAWVEVGSSEGEGSGAGVAGAASGGC